MMAIDYSTAYPPEVSRLFLQQMNQTKNEWLKRLPPEYGWIYRQIRDTHLISLKGFNPTFKKWRHFEYVPLANDGGTRWNSNRKRDYCLKQGLIVLAGVEKWEADFRHPYDYNHEFYELTDATFAVICAFRTLKAV